MEKKSDRLKAIKEIVNNEVISTQEELVKRLNEEGFEVTQATASRDMRELRLTKINTGTGGMKYHLFDNEPVVQEKKYVRILKESVISMEGAQNILVVKTVSGMAMAAAAAMDAIKVPGIIGSIAGDDTIFCAIKTAQGVEDAINFINGKIR